MTILMLILPTMKVALKDEGFEVDTFDSPQLALSSFKPDFCDLVLLDIRCQK